MYPFIKQRQSLDGFCKGTEKLCKSRSEMHSPGGTAEDINE
jgi:hypothetical protein